MKEDVTFFLAIEKLVQEKMFFHQGTLVIKDIDLAEIFEVHINKLREKTNKNMSRFPMGFMVEINAGEYAFTEAGIIMLGGLLKSKRAIKVHIQFIDYFVHLANKNGISVFDIISTKNTS